MHIDKDILQSMGKVALLLTGDCPHVEYFKHVRFKYGTGPGYEDNELRLRHWENSTSIVFDLLYQTTRGYDWSYTANVNLVLRNNIPNHPGRALILDPNWIDTDRVLGWISRCTSEHGEKCQFLPLFKRVDTIVPLYLIDTIQNCLVPGNEVKGNYIALSYTWGETSFFRTKLKYLQQLRIPGALLGKMPEHIAPTVRDAISITRHLGFHYLWVDALCIVQDDQVRMEQELNNMHRIYASASFTIIAAGATDASFELRGFKNSTNPRNLQQVPIQLDASERLLSPIGSPSYGEKPSPGAEPTYHTRAWTLQEHIFSIRRLILKNETVSWECQRYLWTEDLLPHDIADERRLDYAERWHYKSVPSLDVLSDIIMDYNKRNLTYPTDAFPAFAGIQSFLGQIFPFGLIYGHPELFFDIALLWHPIYDVQRRVPSKSPDLNVAISQIPSWSWVGWQGKLAFPFDHEFGIYGSEMEGYIEPVAEWYALESPVSNNRRRIHSDWHKYKLIAQDADAHLPPGWTREPYNITPYDSNSPLKRRHFPREIPNYCYKHSSFKNEQDLKWYPVPVLDQREHNHNPPQTAFIYCRTSRAYLFTSWDDSNVFEDPDERTPPRLQVMDRNKNIVGTLRLNNVDELGHFGNGVEWNGMRRLELVAICKGYSDDIFDFALAKQGGGAYADRAEDCYFVLCIKWEDGVAFRQATGVVTAKAWEGEKETELVDLILG
ncbi:hypothetical protein QQS21_009388 [Conoideocrella luteorostrata]|uniref:Heterokaryon incompatibility domain-containing protein n=1 Tax=Conoideocrella luteorostrata TaxID=1105319 RepID=A0AAJ0FV38_9HYPO|nr:hypothetical protein QQS21_009388 [Conoideocrella luteorostrata]